MSNKKALESIMNIRKEAFDQQKTNREHHEQQKGGLLTNRRPIMSIRMTAFTNREAFD